MDAPLVVAGQPPAVTLGARRLSLVGDERLARLVGRGSERAFGAIYERYYQPLYRYCRSIVREDTDAQDALQSTFASAFAALRSGQRDAPLRPWLFRIAHNEAISLLRRRRNDVELDQCPEQWVGSAADRADELARLALLVADLRELPERQRSALVMRELSGLSHEEIAVVLQTSVGAAKQAVFEARRALMDFVEGRSMECEAIRRTISDGDGRALRARRVRAHLRDCTGCAQFAAAIPARRQDLQALVPALAPAAAAATLARVTGVGSGHGASGGAGAVAATAAGKTVGATLIAKLLVTAAVVVTAAAGVNGMSSVLSHRQHHAHARDAAHHVTPGSAAQRAVGGGAAGHGAALAPPRAGTGRQAALHSRALRNSWSSGVGGSHQAAPTTPGPISGSTGADRSLPAHDRTDTHNVGVGGGSPGHGTGRRASGRPVMTSAEPHPPASRGAHPSGPAISSRGAGSGRPTSPNGTRSPGQSSSRAPTTVPSSTAAPPTTGPAPPSVSHNSGSGQASTPTTPAPGSAPVSTPTTPAPSVTSPHGPPPRA